MAGAARGRGSYGGDGDAEVGCAGEPVVAGEQHAAEAAGNDDVDGVGDRHVVAQLSRLGDERLDRHSVGLQRQQVVARLLCPPAADLLARGMRRSTPAASV